jgi:hypothetical protein
MLTDGARVRPNQRLNRKPRHEAENVFHDCLGTEKRKAAERKNLQTIISASRGPPHINRSVNIMKR